MNRPQTTAQARALANGWYLPQVMSRETKLGAGVFLFVVASSLYMLSNHHPLFPPRLLAMTWIDQLVPFMPLSVWVYMTDYFFALVAFVLCRDNANLNRFCYAFFSLQIVSVLIFWIWPTTYPRELFPLPGDLDSATRAVFTHLRTVDSPNNCCPSLHVSSAFLACFLFLDEQKEKFPWFLGWAIAISISTLTTKQHYLADVLAGAALAIVIYLIFHRWIPYGRQAKR